MANPFEQAARARKVLAMTLYFDIEFAKRDVDPVRDATRVVEYLRALTKEEWAMHAVRAGQNPPKDESQAEIIAVYVAREFEAENVVASKRIGWAN